MCRKSVFISIINANSRNIMLVDQRGVIVSSNEYIMKLFKLPPLTNHQYLATIQTDQYRTDDYNLLKSKSKPVGKLANELLVQKCLQAVFSSNRKDYLVMAESVEPLHWKAILIIER